jgi:hypothetical protein
MTRENAPVIEPKLESIPKAFKESVYAGALDFHVSNVNDKRRELLLLS